MSPNDLNVEVIESADERWISFVNSCNPTLFQSPLWGKLIEFTYGFPARVAAAFREGRVVGGLPFAVVDDFRGQRRVAYAFGDVCEPLGENTWLAIEKKLVNDDISWQIRSRQCPSEVCQNNNQVGVHQSISLPKTGAEAAALGSESQRRNVRLAARAGLTFRKLQDRAGIELFYNLHTQVRTLKHHLLPQPKAFFYNLFDLFFPQHGYILTAELDGKPLATMVFLSEGDTVYYKFGASALDSLQLRPNNFLMWRAIEDAIEQGFACLDLGISEDEGLIAFKDRLGAVSQPTYLGRYCERPESRAIQQMRESLAMLTKTLVDPGVPVNVAQAAADALYRYFV